MWGLAASVAIFVGPAARGDVEPIRGITIHPQHVALLTRSQFRWSGLHCRGRGEENILYIKTVAPPQGLCHEALSSEIQLMI